MKYQHINTLEVKTYKEIRELNKHISYPKMGHPILGDTWKLVEETPIPSYDDTVYRLEEGPIIDFKTTWKLIELSVSEKKEKQDNKKRKDDEIEWREYENARKQAWIANGKPKYGV